MFATTLADIAEARRMSAAQLGGDAAYVSRSDQAEALVRDWAVGMGLDLDDEATVFAVMCGISLARNIASDIANAAGRQCIDVAIVLSNAFAHVFPFVPEAARQ